MAVVTDTEAPRRMRRVVVHTDHIDVDTDAVAPEPLAHEVLVHSVVTGVCGSDTHAAHGRHPFIPIPYHPGHEVVGVVEGLGSQVEGLTVGQRVTVEPDLPCWNCKMCQSGRQNLCENLQFFGYGWDQGGMADWFTVAGDRLHGVPDDLDDQTAALIEPLSPPPCTPSGWRATPSASGWPGCGAEPSPPWARAPSDCSCSPCSRHTAPAASSSPT